VGRKTHLAGPRAAMVNWIVSITFRGALGSRSHSDYNYYSSHNLLNLVYGTSHTNNWDYKRKPGVPTTRLSVLDAE
jgi:hypothetical protein